MDVLNKYQGVVSLRSAKEEIEIGNPKTKWIDAFSLAAKEIESLYFNGKKGHRGDFKKDYKEHIEMYKGEEETFIQKEYIFNTNIYFQVRADIATNEYDDQNLAEFAKEFIRGSDIADVLLLV